MNNDAELTLKQLLDQIQQLRQEVEEIPALQAKVQELDDALREKSAQVDQISEEAMVEIAEKTHTGKIVHRHLKEMTLINQVMTLMSTSEDSIDALQQVCRELAVFLEVPQAGFVVLNPERSAGTVVAENHPPDVPKSLGLEIPVAGTPFAQYIMEHKTPLQIRNAQTDPLMAPVHAIVRQRGVKSMLILPVIVDDEVIGTLGFDAFDERDFSEEQVNVLQHIASQMGQMWLRKQAEDALRESEERYRFLAVHSVDVIWTMDLLLRFTYTSPSVYQLTGYTPEEWIGTRLSQHATRKEFRKMARQALGAIRDYENFSHTIFEANMLHKDGSEIPVEISGRLLLNDKGFPVGVQGSTRDISERRRSEAALRESEKRFRFAMNATTDGLFDWNIQTNEIYFSPGYFSMLGYELDELPHTFDTYEELLHPEDVERSEKKLAEYFSTMQGETDIELRFKAKSGDWIWVLSRGKVVEVDKDGRPLRMVGTNINIDERKKAEGALRFAKERAQQYLNVAGVMLIAVDNQQRVSLINPQGCEILGYAESEIVGQNWFEKFIPNEVSKEVKRVFEKIISGEVEPVEYYENSILRKDGTERLIAWHNSILHDHSGKIIGLFSSGEDITERKQTEKRLEQNLISLQQAESIAQLGYFERNWQTGKGYWSKGFFKLLGYEGKPEAFTHDEFMTYIHPEDRDRVAAHIRWSLQNDEAVNVDFRLVQKSGQVLYIHGVGSNSYDDDGEPLLTRGTFQDITERKRTEDSVRTSQKLAAIGTVAAGIAHEINTPLQIITGLSERVIRQLEKDELDVERLPADMDTLNRNTWRVARIVRSLLTYSHASLDEIVPTDLTEIVQDALVLTEHQLRSWSNVEVVTQLAEGVPLLHCDRGNITQVLINLLTNARDAMPDGGKITISTAFDSFSKRFTLQVSDTGAGIPEEIQQQMYDPFFTTKEVGKGTGMGLSIVMSIVQAHGGEIEVDSAQGQGTTFTICLPEEPLELPTSAEDDERGRYDGMK